MQERETAITYRGRVQNGVIVPEPRARLPEGIEVEFSPVEDDPSIPTLAEQFKDIIGIAEGLPPDSSTNHDHYLYGVPKR